MDYKLDFNEKTILITSVAGFIGSNLAFYFQKKFPCLRLVILDCFRSGKFLSNGNLKSFGHINNLIGFKFDIDSAIEFASHAAGIVVKKIGSATMTINEIIEYESSLNKSSSEVHIKSIDEIPILVQELKSRNKKIVFTNGYFDLLHSGHVKCLETVKSLGDILIISLNSNKSAASLKGKNHPINTESDRKSLLAALEVVDYVEVFKEDTPLNLINIIKSHTLVKGCDYKGKKVIEDDIVKELIIAQLIESRSTHIQHH